jgi:hypothetical protein
MTFRFNRRESVTRGPIFAVIAHSSLTFAVCVGTVSQCQLGLSASAHHSGPLFVALSLDLNPARWARRADAARADGIAAVMKFTQQLAFWFGFCDFHPTITVMTFLYLCEADSSME